MIMIKTTFSDWKSIGYKEALDYAKWKLLAITTFDTDEQRLEIINAKFKGIQFSLKELKQ